MLGADQAACSVPVSAVQQKGWRAISVFILVSLAFCFAVFEKGLWGGALLAPVDIAPNLFSHYRFVDPQATGVPANHFIIDQLAYDLPLQWTIYHAYRRGEIPWWDPFTSCGRPFLADAHISAADPVRIACYLAFPNFVLAYNWTRILHFLLMGVGYFLLLRRLRFSDLIAGSLALAAEFSGANTDFFAHPWIEASFLYYPWLWLVLEEAWSRAAIWPRVVAPLLCACVFYAGNLQSHAYLPIFAFVWTCAHGGVSWEQWKKALRITVPAFLLGLALAAPVLFPELELFVRNHRETVGEHPQWVPMDGPLSLLNFYPWALGGFRTIGYHNLTYVAYIGTAALLLAVGGSLCRLGRPEALLVRRTATGLVMAYLFVMFTPAGKLLYHRASGLAVAGAVVLAAYGVEALFESGKIYRRLGWLLATGAVSIALVSHAMAWVIFPRIQQKIMDKMVAHVTGNSYGGSDSTLRVFQVRNLPHEISFANPEVLAAWTSLAFLAVCLGAPGLRRHRMAQGTLMALNLAPLILFAHRYVPHADLASWNRLLTGGEEQQRIVRLVSSDRLRLLDEAPVDFWRLCPEDFAHFYSIHTVHGYSALQVPSVSMAAHSDPRTVADFSYVTSEFGKSGQLEKVKPAGSARFFWSSSPDRPVKILSESLNTMDVSFPPGAESELVLADTFYPGWTASLPDGTALPLSRSAENGFRLTVPPDASAVHFVYRPSHWRASMIMALAGLGVIAFPMVRRGFDRPPQRTA